MRPLRAAAWASMLWACGGEETTNTASMQAFCDADWPVQTWHNFGQGFVTTYCVSCHSEQVTERSGAPMGVDFDTEEQTLQWAERILATTTGETATMPPGGGPPPEVLQRVRIWLECGVVEAAAP